MGTGKALSDLLNWRPQPKQAEFLRACGYEAGQFGKPVADVIGYGGAAGGGKSDALLALACALCILVPGARVGIFRRRLSDMAGAGGLIQRSHEMLAGVPFARFNTQRAEWRIGQSRLHFCYCESESDVYRYQGWQFDALLIDEATHFSERQVSYLMSRARLNVRALEKPVIAMASNPGNIGHSWFERIFKPMLPQSVRHAQWEGATQTFTTFFVPARLPDNAILCARDPSYRDRLESLDEVLRLQLLDGRWDVFEGVAFPHQPHVVSAAPDGVEWAVWAIGMDWGYAKPFAAVLVAKLPDGRYYVAQEVYEAGLTPAEQAQRVLAMRAGVERLKLIVADASTYAKLDGVTSIADQWQDAGLIVSPATRDRIGSLSLLRSLFRQELVLVHRGCTNLLSELRSAQVDTRTKSGEDITGEDHAIDAMRYAIAELVNAKAEVPPPVWSVAWVKEQARLARRMRESWE
jgi:hypothetical protein